RQQEIVAVAIVEMAVVAVERAFALVHEEERIAVGVARERGHGAAETPEPDVETGIAEQARRRERRGGIATSRAGVERARAHRPFDAGPSGRLVAVMKLARRTEEAVA